MLYRIIEKGSFSFFLFFFDVKARGVVLFAVLLYSRSLFLRNPFLWCIIENSTLGRYSVSSSSRRVRTNIGWGNENVDAYYIGKRVQKDIV